MLFLTDVDHVSFEKANETRQNNLQSATVSLQVVIGLCKRKETAALKIKAAVSLLPVSLAVSSQRHRPTPETVFLQNHLRCLRLQHIGHVQLPE